MSSPAENKNAEGHNTQADGTPLPPPSSPKMNASENNGASHGSTLGINVHGFSMLKESVKADRANNANVIDATHSLLDSLFIIFIASIFQMIFWAVTCERFIFPPITTSCPSEFYYYLSLGVVSALSVGIYLFIFFINKQIVSEGALLILGSFLAVWWAAGLLASTFYVSASNGTGYFAAWFSFIFSCKILYNEAGKLRSMVSWVGSMSTDQKEEFIVLLSGLVVFLSAVFDCGTAGCTAYEGVAMGFGIASTILCFILLFKKALFTDQGTKILVICLGVLWTVGLGVLTIGGPFLAAATWAAFLSSYFLVHSTIFTILPARSQTPETSA